MRSSKHLLRSMCAIGAGLLVSASAGIAQTYWDAYFNPNGQTAAARGGVLHFSDNSSIAVGEATSASNGYDVYVVHRSGASCWASDWEYTYHIGGDDIGRKIRRTSDGGYIIVGTTQNTGAGCNTNDIFLLKLTSAGVVSWARTYGGSNVEEGRDVQQLSDGGYIIAGSTFSAGSGGSGGAAGRDAYLLRVDLNGLPVWGRTYGHIGDEYFLSVEVAVNGDYIASGGASSYSVGGTDIFVTRVAPGTGIPTAGGFYYNYGTTSNEGAWRAIELANGNIAVCGYSRGFLGNSEGIIMLTNSSGVLLGGHYYGGGGSGWDEFLDITQLSGGDLMVTGLFHLPNGGFGGYDIYVGRMNSGTLNPVSDLYIGGAQDDQGWAITRSGSGNANAWMVAGVSKSYSALLPEKMFVVSRPNMNVRGCMDTDPAVTHGSASFTRALPTLWTYLYSPYCTVTPTRIDVGLNYIANCGDCSSTAPAPAPRNGIGVYEGTDSDTRIVPGDEYNSVSSVDESVNASAAFYPNPVRSGSSFTVALPAGSSNAGIVVSDMSGKVVHSGTVEGMETSIDTEGWASGVYVIRLSRGANVEMKRIVVTD